MNQRKAWFIWSIGVCAYIMAVFNRSSLGVTGVAAQERFHAGAGALALFSVMQLGVYASLQVPVGVLVDRIGSRRMLVAGGLLMTAGQGAMAVSHTIPAAIMARVLVGAGDAMTFISVLRLIGSWFSTSRLSLVTQLTGMLGQFGQLLAAVPLVALLHRAGWSITFATVAFFGLTVALVVGFTLSNAPAGTVRVPGARSGADIRQLLVHAWHEPGTQMGLWTHFVTQFPGTTFALLWGYPFLTVGEGLGPGEAALLLTLLVIAGTGFAPLLGQLAARWPMRRSALVFGVVGSSALAWTVVLCWPGQAPVWLLTVLVLVLASNGPGALLGFDYARSFNPSHRMGSASGIVNVGGFVASLITIFAIGVVLDLLTPRGSTAYTLDSFRAAFSVQYLMWAFGLVMFWRHRRVVRTRMAGEGVELDPFHRAVARRIRAGNR